MCGRYTITRHERLIGDLEAVLDTLVVDDRVTEHAWWKARFNVAPTQPAPVVRLRDGMRTLEMMRWGLLPSWSAKPGAKPPLMINARVESLAAKQVFRHALAHERCLVPADGFFEWQRNGKIPTPMYLHPASPRLVAFAGLWARDRPSFTIVTGPPNALVRPIHDRMPMVLDRSAWAAWLDPSLDGEAAYALLTMPSVGDWRVDEVSTRVNKAEHDDPSCIVPIAPVSSSQGSLF
jgi:putative SOS response-associated peptidase YedK